jgi:O-antigen biosynthesis protein
MNGFLVFFRKLVLFFTDPRRIRIKKEIENWKYRPKSASKKSKSDYVRGMVSVIIPVYDRTDELRASVDSILTQTYENYELILVTDGSPPETMAVVESYRSNPKVKIFHFYDNSGNAVRGRNKGIKEASGEFIAFQDSDDIAEAHRLGKSVEFIQQTCADVVYGGWKAKVAEGRSDLKIKNGKEFEAKNFDSENLLNMNYVCQSAVLARKEPLISVGGFKSIMHYREDHELWLRLLFAGFKFKAMPGIVCNLSLHSANNELKFISDDKKWYDLMLREYKIFSRLPLKICYIIPGTSISGGIAVVMQHTNRLLKEGYDVSVFSQDLKTNIDWFPGQKVPIYPIDREYYKKNIDVLVATSWSTAPSMDKMQAVRKIYFVQSDERRFFEESRRKELINETYKIDCEYMTEAKWIQKWLKEEFNRDAHYVPNGLDEKIFFKTDPIERNMSGRPRVLLEGAIDVPYKGMEDAYRAVSELDCEIWIVSNQGKPKPTWRCDRFFENLPIDEMKRVYSSCDIFLKMSRVEGFFGPPLEAMACGCAVVVGKVTGYDEYIKDDCNALVVEQGDIEGARDAVNKLISDKRLMERIIQGGYETAKNWNWGRSTKLLIDIIDK